MLINQPSAKPTRKVVAATLGGLIGPIVAYVLYEQFGISVEATDTGVLVQYGQEASIAIGGALGALLGGYFKRDAAA